MWRFGETPGHVVDRAEGLDLDRFLEEVRDAIVQVVRVGEAMRITGDEDQVIESTP